MALTQILVISLMLGTLETLSAFTLAFAHCMATLIFWFLLPANPEVQGDNPNLKMPSFNLSEYVILFITIIPGLISITKAIPIAPGGTDIWTYHLAFPAEWHIWHDLRASVQCTGDPGPPYYPHHSGLIAHLLITTLQSDLCAKFHQLPMAILGLIALYQGIRNLDLPKPHALTAVSLVATMPLVSSWVSAAFADISLAGAIGLLFYSTTRLKLSQRWQTVLVFGLTTGICAGFKAFGLYYSLPLVFFGLARIIRKKQSWPTAIGFWLLGTILTGAFWFLRSLVFNGNPVFPYRLSLFGSELFPGLYGRDEVLNHGFHSLASMKQFTISALMTTIGISGFILGILLIVSIFYVKRKHLFLFIIPLTMFIQFYFLPYRHHPRFFLPALWMCAPAAALAMASLSRKLKLKAFFSPFVIIGVTLLTPYPGIGFWLRIALVISTILLLLFVSRIRQPRLNFSLFLKPKIIIPVMTLIFLFLPLLTNRYERQKWSYHDSELGRVAQWICELNAKQTKLKIAFAGFNTPYPLTGPGLTNSVRYLSHDGVSEKSWAGDRQYSPVAQVLDSLRWRELIEETRIDLFVIGTLPGQPFGPEYFELRSMNTFELVYYENSYQCWLRKDLITKIL